LSKISKGCYQITFKNFQKHISFADVQKLEMFALPDSLMFLHTACFVRKWLTSPAKTDIQSTYIIYKTKN